MQLTGEQGQDVEDADLSLGSASSPLTKQRITRSFSVRVLIFVPSLTRR